MKLRTSLPLCLITIGVISTLLLHAQEFPDSNYDISNLPNYYSGEPAITATENMVFTIWEDYRDGKFNIYFKRSVDGTAPWKAEKRIYNSSLMSLRPDIAAIGNTVYAVWQEKNEGTGVSTILYSKSDNSGDTWAAPTMVNTVVNYSGFPAIFANSTGVYVVWEDGRTTGNDEIYFRFYNNTTSSWEVDRRVSTMTNDSWASDIAVDNNGTIHIVWQDYTNTTSDEIYYARSSNNGASWTTMPALTNTGEISWDPKIAVDQNNNLHVVWYDWIDKKDEVYYKKSSNGGTSWGTSVRISDLNTADSRYPDVAAIGDKVVVVWEDYRDSNDEIYCSISPDLGTTWGVNERCTNDPGESWAAVATTNSKGIYVSWYDTQNGSDDVFDVVSNQSITGIISNVHAAMLNDLITTDITPNPMTQSTKITYNTSHGYGISIFTLDGAMVKYLADREKNGTVVWNGTDQFGNKVSAGNYVYKIKNNVKKSGTITIVR